MSGIVLLIPNLKLFSVRELDNSKSGNFKKVVRVRFFSCNDSISILIVNFERFDPNLLCSI